MHRLPLRVTELVAVLVALGLGTVISVYLPFLGGEAPPFVRSFPAHDTARVSWADVRVTDVTTARYLVTVDETTLVPSGVFLLVSTALRPVSEPLDISSVWLTDDDGRIYEPSDRSGCADAFSAPTGISTYTVLCFEVPPALLDQYRLEVSRGSTIYNAAHEDDDIADLDLGISASRVAGLSRPELSYEVSTSGLAPCA